MVLTAAIIFGGVKRIATISSSVVPMMALFYLIMAVIILGMHIDMIPTVIANIYKSAFTFQSAAGGMFGALVSKAMMMGIKRGLFSNEAGMGSAPNAAAAAYKTSSKPRFSTNARCICGYHDCLYLYGGDYPTFR